METCKSGPRIQNELNNLCNYRPISVIPTVAKIFEKFVYDQPYNYLNENNLFTSCQSAFRSLHSTLTALIETTNNWSVNIDDGLLNGVVFIALQKAFDTIDHSILVRKLCNRGIDQTRLGWFKSYLSDRTQKCSVNGHLSNVAPVSCGVPQGRGGHWGVPNTAVPQKISTKTGKYRNTASKSMKYRNRKNVV